MGKTVSDENDKLKQIFFFIFERYLRGDSSTPSLSSYSEVNSKSIESLLKGKRESSNSSLLNLPISNTLDQDMLASRFQNVRNIIEEAFSFQTEIKNSFK